MGNSELAAWRVEASDDAAEELPDGMLYQQ